MGVQASPPCYQDYCIRQRGASPIQPAGHHPPPLHQRFDTVGRRKRTRQGGRSRHWAGGLRVQFVEDGSSDRVGGPWWYQPPMSIGVMSDIIRVPDGDVARWVRWHVAEGGVEEMGLWRKGELPRPTVQ